MRFVFGLWLGASALTAWAQGVQTATVPTMEAGVAYSYNDLSTSDTGQSIQSGALAYGLYFFRWSSPQWGGHSKLAIATEFGGSGSGSGSLYTYVAGPRWGTEWKHVFLYGGSEIGGARIRVNGVGPDGVPAQFVRNSFAANYALAGVDLIFGRTVIKLLQADDLALQTPDPSTGKVHWRGGIRVSAGIGFRFGSRQP